MENNEMNNRLVEQQIAESMAVSAKLNAETAKIMKETYFYPWVIVVSASVGGAVAGIFAVILKLI